MNRINAICFDLDGTLTDPKLGITRSIQYALEQLGVAAPATDELTWCIGPPLLASFQEMLGDTESANAALMHYRERFAKTGLFENQVYDGIPASIERLVSSGVSLFVATSKPQVFAERIITHFDLSPYFERVFGPALDGALANKTDLLKYALDEVKVSPDRTMMVGDRSHDMIGARRNGVGATGVLYGYGSKDELESAGAQSFVTVPSDLADVLG